MLKYIKSPFWWLYRILTGRRSDDELTAKLREVLSSSVAGEVVQERAGTQICIIDFTTPNEQSLCARQIHNIQDCTSYATMVGGTAKMYTGGTCPPNTRPVSA